MDLVTALEEITNLIDEKNGIVYIRVFKVDDGYSEDLCVCIHEHLGDNQLGSEIVDAFGDTLPDAFRNLGINIQVLSEMTVKH